MKAAGFCAALALLASAGASAAPTWVDATAAVGLDFREAGEIHPPGNGLWPAAPEIFGGGACWSDFDRDGYPDLYLVSQRYNELNPAYTPWHAAADPRGKLYHNNGDGTLRDVTAFSGLDSRSFGFGCSAGDYDDDGWIDLYVAGFGPNILYHNDGDGTFTDVTAAAGEVADGDGCGAYECESASSAWGDYDGDGDLDLYVGNYVDTNMTDSGRGPQGHVAQPNFLLRNNGDGTFTDVALEAGVRGDVQDDGGSKTLGMVWSDLDIDGDLDLYVANDMEPNDYYVNQGNGTFLEKSEAAGLDDDRASMGLAISDYDNDCLPDLFFTHYSSQHNGFFRNRGDGTFEDRSGEDDLANDFDYVGWGTAFVDIDNDADLDIIVVNGHTDWAIDHVPIGPGYDQIGQVWRNDPETTPQGPGDRLWVDISTTSGEIFTNERVARGAAWADYDLDGDADFVIVPNANDTAEFAKGSNVPGNWLRLELVQGAPNRDAIGAHVRLEAGGIVQCREIQAGSSYLSQNELALTFGLGDLVQADLVTVTWPDGATTVLSDQAAGQALRIDRATASVTNDTLAPVTRLVGDSAGNLGWWAGPVSITLSATDRGVTHASGVVETQFRLPDGEWQAYHGQSFVYTDPGVYSIQASSTDAMGNREAEWPMSVGIDTTAPAPWHVFSGQSGEAGWWVADPVLVTLGMDDDLSGPGKISYSLDDGPWLAYEGPVAVAGDGVHAITYVAEDVAGNTAMGSLVVALDATPPLVAVTRPEAGALYLDGEAQPVGPLPQGPAVIVTQVGADPTFLLSAAATDAASGVSVLALFVDGTMVADDSVDELDWLWDTASAAPGPHTIEAKTRDGAGHRSVTGLTVVLAGASDAAPAAAPPLLGGLQALLLGGVALLALPSARRR